MSNALQNFEYNSSLQEDSNNYLFKDHQYIYYNDLSNGSYNSNTSEIKFDLTNINTDDFVDWSESTVLIPIELKVTAITGNFTANTPENAFALSLKNGYQHLIDSMYISYAENPINQPAGFANIDMTWRLYSMSEDDRKNLGDMLNFYMDTSDTIRYVPVAPTFQTGNTTINSISTAGVVALAAAAANVKKGQQFYYQNVLYTVTADSTGTAPNVIPKPNTALAAVETVAWIIPSSLTNSGLGECNNVISKSTLFNPAQGFQSLNGTVNTGRLKRMMSTSFDPTTVGNPISTNFQTPTAAGIEWKNYVTANSANEITYNIFATIPLSVLHDFFNKLPLIRGAPIKLNIYCNTGITIFETVNLNQHVSIDPAFNIPRNTVPFMVSPIVDELSQVYGDCGTGFNVGTATRLKYTLKIGNEQCNTCRMYVSTYKMTSAAESHYISSPMKPILYNDIANFTISKVTYNQTVNNLLTSGISRLRGILIVPTISADANVCGLSGPQSIFSSSPATTFPYVKIQNFQIQINGRPVFNTPISYSFQYYNQIRNELSINGASLRSIGNTSGCISKTDSEAGYGYYYVDLQNYENECDDSTSKSIQVLFQNVGIQPNPTATPAIPTILLDFNIFVYFQKQINLNVSTGQCLRM